MIDNRTFEGGMNMDSDETRMKPNEYRYALNIINGSTRNGAAGVITNMKGNEEVTFDFGYNTNAPRVIGAYNDTKKNRVFFFVADGGLDSIYYYDIVNKEVKTVIRPNTDSDKNIDTSVLGFDRTRVIPEVNIDIVYRSEGDLLLWTDGKAGEGTEPKKINIPQAERTISDTFIGYKQQGTVTEGQVFAYDIAESPTSDGVTTVGNRYNIPSGEFVYYFKCKIGSILENNRPAAILDLHTVNTSRIKSTIQFRNLDRYDLVQGEVYPIPLNLEDITQMPKAPLEPPTAQYGNNQSRKANYLKNKLWQFRYKYVYDDDQESAWSPISEVPLPRETILDYTENSNIPPVYVDNVIRTFLYANLNSRVKTLKVATRYGGSDEGKSDWLLLDEIAIRENNLTFTMANKVETTDDDPLVKQSKIGSLAYAFSNDKTLTPIDILDIVQLYYNAPRKSNSQTITEDNRVVHGGITEGYDIDLNELLSDPTKLNATPIPLKHPLVPDERTQIGIEFNVDPISTQTGPGDFFSPTSPNVIVDNFSLKINDPNDEIEAGDVFVVPVMWFAGFREREVDADQQFYDLQDWRAYPRQVFVNDKDNGHNISNFNHTWVKTTIGRQVDIDGATRSIFGESVYNKNPLDLTYTYVVTEQDVDEAANQSVPKRNIVAQRIASFYHKNAQTYVDVAGHGSFSWIDEKPFTIGTSSSQLLFYKSWKFNSNYFGGSNTEEGDYNFSAFAINDTSQPIPTPNDDPYFHGFEDVQASGDVVNFNKSIHLNTKQGTVGGNSINDLYSYNPSNGNFEASTVESYEFKAFYTFPEYPKFIPATVVGGIGNERRSFKRGQSQQLAIAYSDRFGRMSSGIKSASSSFTVPYVSDNTGLDTWDGNKNEAGAVWAWLNVEFEAPDWATHWHVLRVNNKPKKRFIQIPTSDDTTFDGTRNIFDLVDLGSGNPLVKIYLDALNGGGENAFNNLFENKSILSYQYTKGDRVRFLYKLDTSGAGLLETPTKFYVSDVEIVKFSIEDNAIFVRRGALESNLQSVFDTPNLTDASVAAGIVFEIYSPSTNSDSEVYYEVARTFEVEDGQHKVSRVPRVLEQDSLQEEELANGGAKVLLWEGDVYYKARLYYTDGANLRIGFVEDDKFSDFYQSDFTSIGRPNLTFKTTNTELIRSGTVKSVYRESSLVYSEAIIPETNINRIGTFYDTSIKDYNRIHGKINALVAKDYRVQIFFDDRVGWIMLGRQIIEDLNSQGLVGTSTGVVSKINYYAGEYGCVVPESIQVYGYRTYFADPKRGAFLRLSMDGMTEINTGIDTYLKRVFQDQYESKSDISVIGAYDRFNDLYVANIKRYNYQFLVMERVFQSEYKLTSLQGIDINFLEQSSIFYKSAKLVLTNPLNEDQTLDFYISSVTEDAVYGDIFAAPTTIQLVRLNKEEWDTIGFSENIKRWVSFYSYNPSYMISAGLGLISFRGEFVYLHEENDNRANFYGEDYNTLVQPIFNKGFSFRKFYKSIQLNSSDDVWDANTYGLDVLIDPHSFRRIFPLETNIQSNFADSINSAPVPYQTTIPKDNFRYDEGMLEAAISTNLNSVADDGSKKNSLNNGEQMRGIWLKVLLNIAKGQTKEVKLSDVTVRFSSSEMNQSNEN